MIITRLRGALLATIFAATCAPSVIVPARAATPAPSPAAHTQTLPPPQLPATKLHTEYVVEVNKKGQVVRAKSGKGSVSKTFNIQTYGNAMQMWIRKPDGSATVGLYKVTYDYDPKTHGVARNISLVSAGGDWGDQEGAADVMMDTAKAEAAAALKKQQEQNKNLPSLNTITGKSPSPSPSPQR